MFLIIISILGILVEVSLPYGININIVSMSFLTYLSHRNDKNYLPLVVLIAILLSLQRDNLYWNLFVIIFLYYQQKKIFTELSYELNNVVITVFLGAISYIFINKFSFTKKSLLINILGLLIFNLIYIFNARRLLKKRIKNEK